MYEFLWHGRGGQGAFSAAKILGCAYSLSADNHKALAFPSFGPERRGAPIKAFTKLDTKKINDRSQIAKADFVLITDDTLFNDSVFDELKDNGKVILCTKQILSDPRIVTIDGVSLALKHLGLAITNTVLLGAVAALFEDIKVEFLKEAISQNLPKKLWQKNFDLVTEAYEQLRSAK